jgi:hypothetical protein
LNYAAFSDTNQQFPGNCTWMVKVQGSQFVSLTGRAHQGRDDSRHVQRLANDAAQLRSEP